MKFTAADGSKVRLASFETRAAALIFFDGHSYREAAKILGSTRMAVARACVAVNKKLVAANLPPLSPPEKDKRRSRSYDPAAMDRLVKGKTGRYHFERDTPEDPTED